MLFRSAVPDSVLWLAQSHPIACDNLRREAQAHGVAAQRLVFAPREPDLAAHMSRYRAADLFLDTLPFNAHTTASDALWAGLPIVTCAGTTYAGRVTTSLLNALGLPELVTQSLEHYEALSIQLATKPTAIARYKAHLESRRLDSPLFSTNAFAQALEIGRAHV